MKKLFCSVVISLFAIGLMICVQRNVQANSSDPNLFIYPPHTPTEITQRLTLLRITDSNADEQVDVSYSSGSSFNADTSRFFIYVNGTPVFYKFDAKRLTFKKEGPLFEGQPHQLESCEWSATDPDTIIGLARFERAVRILSYNLKEKSLSALKDFSNILPAGLASNMVKSRNADNLFTFNWKEDETHSWRYSVIWDRTSDETYLFDLKDQMSGVSEFKEARFDNSGQYLIVTGDTTRIWHYRDQSQSAAVEIAPFSNEYLNWQDKLFGPMTQETTIFQPSGLLQTAMRLSAGELDYRGLPFSSALKFDDQTDVLATDRHFYIRSSNPTEEIIFRVAKDGRGIAERLVNPVQDLWSLASRHQSNVSPDGRLLIFNSSSGVVEIAVVNNDQTSPENVEWVDLVNCALTDTRLQKTGGIEHTEDARAASAQYISSGDGYVQFTADENDKERVCGLNTGGTVPTVAAGINYALKLNGKGKAFVMERGEVKKKTRYKSGDTFCVAIESGIIQYRKNDKVLYSSDQEPVYPLMVSASLKDKDSTISNALITGASKGIVVSITPDKAVLGPGESQQFSAQATSPKYSKLTWTATGGTITNSGLYTAPNVVGTYRVRAASPTNPSVAASALVYVTSSDTIPPVISQVTASGVTASEATITWLTDELADEQVEYGLTTGYGSASVLNTSMSNSHTVALSGLAPDTQFHYRVRSCDASGNLSLSSDFTFRTKPPVSITAPVANQTVAGTVVVSADATNPSGIAGVRFKVDGNNIGAEDTTSPYSVSFDTRSLANGTHTLTAVARNSLGNLTTSPPVAINIRQFFVSPTGASGGNGSKSTPWDLRTALSQPANVQPGDTIWLRGGTYSGIFTSSLTGTASAPIIVRQFPGERAIIDGDTFTRLSASISASQTSFTVTDASKFKTNILIRVDNEDLAITSLNGNTFTVTRGTYSTTPTTHAAGTAVRRFANVLTINGAYTWYWGFEVTNSYTNRVLSTSGSNPPEKRGEALIVYGPGSKIINLIIHDTGQGIGFWSQAVNAEVYGNIIYNNGWEAPDRGHGHGIYTQNDTGTKRILDNILFDNFGDYGIHAYGSSAASLTGFYLEGNVSFHGQWLVGGIGPAGHITMVKNYLYGSGFKLGYSNRANEDATVRDNYVYATLPLQASWWRNLTVTGNTFVGKPAGSGSGVTYYMREGGVIEDHFFDNNTHYNGRTNNATTIFNIRNTDETTTHYTFNEWRQLGYDLHGTYISLPNQPARPTGIVVKIRPNQYEPGRAHIIIYNWQLATSVSVGLSESGLKIGQHYEIRDAQNFLGAPVASGVYNGNPVTISLTGLTAVNPIGNATRVCTHTSPEFATFVLVPTGTSSN